MSSYVIFKDYQCGLIYFSCIYEYILKFWKDKKQNICRKIFKPGFTECLFTDTLLTWIIIQTPIRNTDSYSDTDLENLHISLSHQWFSLNMIKVSQRVSNDQIIDGKTSLQKSVILPIIRGVSPT